MGHYSYNEKLREHNRAAECQRDDDRPTESALPDWFDFSLFEDEQLEYLNEYEQKRRGDLMRGMLDFMTADRERWVERICVLDKLINRKELTWREAPAFYGLSNHRFFDAKNMLEVVFAGYGEHILKLLQVRKARNLTRKKKSAPPSSCHEMEG